MKETKKEEEGGGNGPVWPVMLSELMMEKSGRGNTDYWFICGV